MRVEDFLIGAESFILNLNVLRDREDVIYDRVKRALVIAGIHDPTGLR